MDLPTLNRVLRTVRSILPSHFDTESIAMDILIESWSNQIIDPAYSFIRHRCLDAARSSRREHEVLVEAAEINKSIDSPDDSIPADDRDMMLNYLTSVLDSPERKAIFFRFYLDLSTLDISARMALDPSQVRELLASAIYKMKEAAY